MARSEQTLGRMIRAGLLAWILPGLGHYTLGHRALGLVFFLGITIPYVVGLAIGGLKLSVNPWSNHWLFLAEMGAGGYTTVSLLVNRNVGALKPYELPDLSSVSPEQRSRILARMREHSEYLSFYPESDVAQIYLATAGLLNLLAILDALTRAQTGGLPTYYRELSTTSDAAGGGG